MFEAIASVLQLIVQPCHALTGNWWVSILLFTVITKIVLLPMSLWCQKNAIVMVQLMPELNRLKAKYFGDRETIGEKQNELYKQHRYHPMLSLVPLAVQILILFGLVDVIHSITDNGAPGTELLGLIPVEDGGISWIWPVLAGASAVVMGYAQNRINPLQREQSRAEKNMTNGLSIGLSLVLALFVAAGMAFYWVCSNLSSIAIQALCNVIIKPSKHIDYDDLEESRKELAAYESVGAKKPWYKRDPLAKREKADYKRFFDTVDKHIVFYSEGSGFYKYFEGAVRYLLAHSTGCIHYVTNDPNDQVFALAESMPRLKPYYISEKRAITLMMKMDADIVVLTLEDLDNYYIKRSYVRKDAEYVFFYHHMTSAHLVSRKNAVDHYDTIMCVGPHQVREIRRAEELYGLPAKNLVECGSALLDKDIARYEKLLDSLENDAGRAAATENGRKDVPTVIIAPSWQYDNILDSCIDPLLESLLELDVRIIVRPHPEYTKRYAQRWQALQERYARWPQEKLMFERDFTSDETIWTSDILVTDWSSVFCEFSFSTLKPSIFIDTTMKVVNPDWEELGITPTDISLRNEVGVSIAPADAGTIGEVALDMIENPGTWSQKIEQVRAATIFNIGSSSEVAGAYLLSRLLARQSASDEEAVQR